jgi:hypothetical protein
LLARILFGSGGFLIGSGLFWLGGFAASFGNPEPQWDAESMALVTAGLFVVGGTVIGAFRPTKVNIAIAAAALIVIPVMAQTL